jgi:glycine/D-amino acid oxidase-like deaminating enzyme
MGYSADMLPRIGQVPGRKNVFIMGGFTGHGMPQIFLGAKGLSKMVLEGAPYSETGIPRLFEETKDRLASEQNQVLELHTSLPPLAKL